MEQTLSSHLRPTLVCLALFTLLLGIIYPGVVTAVLQLCFPFQAQGSLIKVQDKIIGSQLIGQPFTQAKYFWSRPSATDLFPYNSAASGGSNLGSANPQLLLHIKKRLQALAAIDPQAGKVPVDLVTTSASGLDPHISIAAALYQLPRVAAKRNLPEQEVKMLINLFTTPRACGLLGEPRVNVLNLNLQLDEISRANNGN